ncbi:MULTISPECIES: DcrB-related protein [Pantoea]|uniref:DcrB-related protein n=1 Tax=Pantoea TaxID=53335 RepID=UPI000CF538D1|nr:MULTISPECIES: DUF1795 domain-containing protein [Pantoea]MCW1834747.1 DUF1795 domain-containing protein [Pantoea ananatis]PQK69585.1 hypothetical protein CG428_21940 [Pantoea ananatis]WRH23381.1 DUF1795 domain-containing protein [Pantoea sp. JZ29]
MNLSPHDCLFTEGMLTLPAGYQDRTVNVFTAPGQPPLNLSRDRTEEGENLSDYVTRQTALMAQHLKGWKLLSRDTAVPGNDLGQGEVVEATYLRGGKRVSQRQAVFVLPDTQVLVFTVSADGPLTDPDRDVLNDLLLSFRLHG